MSVKGSSPLTRGKPFGMRNVSPGWGLIPAHAGKTDLTGPLLGRYGAHPRSRGENLGGPLGAGDVAGSSPLTRGKPRVQLVICGSPGLIPAHAGTTPGSRRSSAKVRAHPRSRGENPA